jgi:hypothetical protein
MAVAAAADRGAIVDRSIFDGDEARLCAPDAQSAGEDRPVGDGEVEITEGCELPVARVLAPGVLIDAAQQARTVGDAGARVVVIGDVADIRFGAVEEEGDRSCRAAKPFTNFPALGSDSALQ